MRLVINYPILGALIAATFSSQPAFVGATKLRGNSQDAAVTPQANADLVPRRLKKSTTSTTCASSSIVDVQYADRSIDETYLACETSDGKSFKVKGVPASVVKANRKGIIDGTSELDLPDGSMLDEATGTIDLPPGQALKFREGLKNGGGNGNGNSTGNNGNSGNGGGNGNGNSGGKKGSSLFDRNRHLAITGSRSVLVVRVIAADGETSASELRLSDSVFGNGVDGIVDAVTLRSQYAACSDGQLNFVEVADKDGTDMLIRNGTSSKFIHYLNFHCHLYYLISFSQTHLFHFSFNSYCRHTKQEQPQ